MDTNAIKGTLFDIQRFSVHDGPGIRTTLFMKGCPLRCQWCHNPEGLSSELQLQFFKETCIGCGKCGNRNRLSDAENCPANALTVCGKTMTVSEIVNEVLKDTPFYGQTGGVTFSGGECLLQSDFVTVALKEMKRLGLHTVIDTCGYVPWNNIEPTLAFCDLYLYDIKCMDPLLHETYTGVNNRLIIENLKRLSAQAKEIWIRVPVIPNFNNTETAMNEIASFIATLPSVKQVTLIPYHALGASKYETLGLSCQYPTTLKISKHELEQYGNMFASNNILVK